MKLLVGLLATALCLSPAAFAVTASDKQPSSQDYSRFSEDALKAELDRLGIVEEKVLMLMRDGVSLSSDIYRPKDAKGPVPTIFDRTPYNMNVLRGRSLLQVVEALDRGYAYIRQNERGRYFSEGDFEILGHPATDGYDALTWIAGQGWSNGKVGTLGCSSSAEWQLQLAAENHPAHAAMIPSSSGAGIGRVGEFYEQGNWYRGGVPRMLFYPWLYDTDNPLRAQIPKDLDPETRRRLSQYNDLDPKKPKVDWAKQVWHLPVADMLPSLGEPPGTFDEFIQRLPDDPAWYEGGLYHDDKGWGVPALWYNSWYDVSIGPNMALFNHASTVKGDEQARTNQYTVVSPSVHCGFGTLKDGFTSGDRDLGNATFPANDEMWAFFDHFLKGEKNNYPKRTPHVRYFSMGDNAWKIAKQWPPAAAKETRLYLRSAGNANSLYGDGRLDWSAATGPESPDTFVYDPETPVQTIGGGDCCNGGVVIPGAFDQRPIEVRNDVLVYQTEPLTEPVSIAGFVDAVLNVSSDAMDTDFIVKLVDVGLDGKAYILDDTIFRARFREGYDKEVFMEPGQTYKLDFTPMTTANTFLPGHRIRVEVSSSSFPKYIRNLNTGGRNEFESEGVIATNQVHHALGKESYIVLPLVQ